MATDVTGGRGQGHRVGGTRLTVYNLLPDFLDPEMTEVSIGRLYDLTPEQVASARAYILNNADAVLDQHLRIEERIAQGNPPEVIEQMKKARETFRKFREWRGRQRREAARESGGSPDQDPALIEAARLLPRFKEWLAEQESRPKGQS